MVGIVCSDTAVVDRDLLDPFLGQNWCMARYNVKANPNSKKGPLVAVSAQVGAERQPAVIWVL